jgi:tRNA/rRNA methyltransferase
MISSEVAFHLFIILVRPESMANVGAVARAMKNTGFHQLRIVGINQFTAEAFRLAVHARDILEKAAFFPNVETATADLQVVFASTAKKRKNFTLITLEEMVEKVIGFSPGIKIGLLFGPERTGLESRDLRWANYCFVIPQASNQPSYNLAGAVLITLFQLFRQAVSRNGIGAKRGPQQDSQPLSVTQQRECINFIIKKLTERGFIHRTNRKHMEERLHDLFGRLTINERDRKLLLALFGKIPYHSSR